MAVLDKWRRSGRTGGGWCRRFCSWSPSSRLDRRLAGPMAEAKVPRTGTVMLGDRR